MQNTAAEDGFTFIFKFNFPNAYTFSQIVTEGMPWLPLACIQKMATIYWKPAAIPNEYHFIMTEE